MPGFAVWTMEDLSEATLNWSKSRQLGSGSYGAVFKGEMKAQQKLAVNLSTVADAFIDMAREYQFVNFGRGHRTWSYEPMNLHELAKDAIVTI